MLSEHPRRARTAAVVLTAVVTCGALSAATTPKAAPNDAPVLVVETTHADGSTTSEYSDGSSFTFEAPSSGPGEFGRNGIAASAVQSRDWSATYSVSITSQYFHHDGGEIKLVVGPFSDCGVSQTVYLLVASSWGGYTQTGKKSIACTGGTIKWDSPEGNKKFEIQDPNTGDRYFPHDVSGTVYWND